MPLAEKLARWRRPEWRKRTSSWDETQHDELTDLVHRQILRGLRYRDGPDDGGDGQSSENEHHHGDSPPSALAMLADGRRLQRIEARRCEALRTTRSPCLLCWTLPPQTWRCRKVPPFFQHISQHQRIAQQPHLGSDPRTNADVDPREGSVLMEPTPAGAIASCGARSHAPAMFVVSETEAAAIRAAFDRDGA